MCILIVFLTTIEVFLRGRMVINNCEKLYDEDIKYFQKKRLSLPPEAQLFKLTSLGNYYYSPGCPSSTQALQFQYVRKNYH